MPTKKQAKKKAVKKKTVKKKQRRGVNKNETSKAKALKLQRQEEALSYRIAGLSYSKIATAMNMSKANCHRLVVDALADSTSRTAKNADDLRDLELERLDKLIVGLWPYASKGHPNHVRELLKVMEQRQKLTGIQAAPQVLGEILAETGTQEKPSLRVRVTYVKPEPNAYE